MAFVPLTAGQVDKKSPVDDQLMDTIRLDLDDLDARITAGGSGSGSGIDALAEKAEQEHYKINTDRFPNSVHESFSKALPAIEYFLLKQKANTGTAIHMGLNVVYLEDANKNFDGNTGWTAFGDASNIGTDSTNHAIGANMPNWDKAGGTNVLSGLYKDLGTANVRQIGNNTKFLVEAYFPNTTNLIKAHLRLANAAETTVATNYLDIEVSVDSDGAAFTSGLNLLEFDCATGTQNGTGYDYKTPLRVIGLIYEYSSAAQTVTGLAFDSPVFSLTDFAQFVRKGMQFTINDNTNVETLTIAQNSAKLYAHVDLAAAPTNTYAGGSGTRFRRNTLTVSTNVARMEDGLSGGIANRQTVRFSRILPEALTSNTLSMIVSQLPQNFFEVTDVDSSTQIKVSDAGNLGAAQFKSGDKFYVFAVNKIAGKTDYEYRSLELTLSADSTYSAPKLTLQTGTNTGVAVGDIIIKRDLEVYLNTIAKTGVNESPGTKLDPTKLYLEDVGTPYSTIGPQYLYAHWPLGGTDGLKNLYGPGADLSENAGPTNRFRDFMNGLFAAGVWATAGDRFYLPTGSADELLGDSGYGAGLISFSFWFKYIGSISGTNFLIGHSTSNLAGNSWSLQLANPTANILLVTSGSTTQATLSAASVSDGQWHMISGYLDDGVGSALWADETKTSGSTPAHTGDNAASQFAIGDYLGAANPAVNAYMADLKVWTGYQLTDGNVSTLFSAGLGGGKFGKRSYFNHYFEKATQSGQWITGQIDAIRRSDAVNNMIAKAGVIKK